MEPWLDSLSEDWKSEHQSSSLSLPRGTPDHTLRSSLRSSQSQSRIPRISSNHSQGSVKSNYLRPRSHKGLARSKTSPVLGEQSSSKLNVAAHLNENRSKSIQNTKSRDADKYNRSAISSLPRRTSAAFSDSQQSVQHHTIHDTGKRRDRGGTPEWKRRLANGENLGGSGSDLFGRTKLEGIFQQPSTTSAKAELGSSENLKPWALPFRSSEPSSEAVQTQPSMRASRGRMSGMEVLPEENEDEGYSSRPGESDKFLDTDDIVEDIRSARNSIGVEKIGTIGTSSSKLPETRLRRSLSDNGGLDPRLRTLSGMEEIRNEEISPINMSRTNTLNLGAAVAKRNPPRPLRKASTIIPRESESQRPTSPLSDSVILHGQDDSFLRNDFRGEPLPDVTSNSLPDDLSMGTHDFVTKGGFVNIRRGGYSNDNSFLKRNLSSSSMPARLDTGFSCLSPPLKSSPPINASLHNAEASRVSTPIQRLTTPTPEDNDLPSTPSPTKASGSPLKIFGNYDTFTSNRLLTRIGQFEVDDVVENSEKRASQTSDSMRSLDNHKVYEPPVQPLEEFESSLSSEPFRMSQFGKGELDQFTFKQNASRSSTGSLSQQNTRKGPDDRIFDFSPEGTPEGAFSNPNNHYKSTSLPKVRKNGSRQADANVQVKITRVEQVDQTITQVETHEQKRVLHSPGKERTPKRRRTLLRDETEHINLAPESVKDLNDPVQMAGRKRKDARYDSNGSIADPEVLATRQMLRPRTAQRRSSSQLGQEHAESGSPSNQHTENGNFAIEDQGDLVSVITNEVASAGADITRMANEARKGSVTTQDFLNEATKIMNLIRQKGKQKAAMEILKEPENESELELETDDFADSTKENFSRPPSREGSAPNRRPGYQPPQDPRVVSHLRKYAEEDDPAAVLNSSMVSLKIAEPQDRPMSPPPPEISEGEFQMSPINIRIRESIDQQRKRKHSTSTAEDGQSTRRNTQSSYGNSTGQSVPTASSKSSGQKGVISPGKVEIPNQLGPMVFDPLTKTWKKNKACDSGKRESKERATTSDEDPFEDIPDLSIDEAGEKKQTVRLRSFRETDTQSTTKAEKPSHAMPLSFEKGLGVETKEMKRALSSDVIQTPTRAIQSEPDDEMSSTSRSDPHSLPAQEAPSVGNSVHSLKLSEEAEHEIRIHEGRASEAPGRSNANSKQPRVVTITFSSPLVSGVAYQDDHSISDITSRTSDRISLDDAAIYSETPESTKPVQDTTTKWRPNKRNISAPLAPRRRSGVDFVGRPVSRIDEQDEESSINGEMSLIHVADPAGAMTPIPQRTQGGPIAPPTGGKGSSLLCLTPLSEFTLHQADDPIHLELSYVAQRAHPTSLQQAHGQLSLAVDDMVKAITDMEPYEPYWTQLRRLNLSGKSLTTLHMLQDYCSELEELDISNNGLGQLSGAPLSLRLLTAADNCLTNLTSWGSLHNLQYLDISNNGLESLEGFSGLVHLRELKANHNQIRSIDGIFDLNGLLSLKLKGNELASVDFEGAELTRLKELDLSGNKLSSVNGVEYLPSLETLDIGDNIIEGFSFRPDVKVSMLRSLILSNNKLHSLDVAPFPVLELLYLDRNKITSLLSFSGAYNLQIVSLREQRESPDIINLAFSTVHDCRKLYLSSNVCPPDGLRKPSLPLLNLQYLELASCGLTHLPDDFAAIVPNCRVINLNFNAIKSVASLEGILRLNKILLAGNRISKMRNTCAVLGKLSALTKIDLRNNPLTIGFYAPANTREHRLVLQDPEKSDERDLVDSFTLPDADQVMDEKWLIRLDETTRIKRRIMTLLLAERCGQLLWLDGMDWNRDDVLRVDSTGIRLKELGILKDEYDTYAPSVEDWVSEH